MGSEDEHMTGGSQGEPMGLKKIVRESVEMIEKNAILDALGRQCHSGSQNPWHQPRYSPKQDETLRLASESVSGVPPIRMSCLMFWAPQRISCLTV